MTRQQHADLLLASWQQHRDLPPEARMIRLPIIISDDAAGAATYQAKLDAVAAAMQEAA